MYGKAKEGAEIDSEKEMISLATVQAMGKDEFGNITVYGLQQELEGEATVEQIRKKIVITVNDSQRMYYVDDNGNVYEYIYTDLPTMEYGDIFNNRIVDYKASILTVTVLDNINIPENTYKVFDISKEQDGTVKAWLVPNEENAVMYDLYIGGNDGVKASSCKNMFADLKKCLAINLEYLYTENVTNFNYMFQNCNSMTSINLSNIDTSKATGMNSMFVSCSNLAEIDVSNFDTSNVKDMAAMFYGMEKLETIDLSTFDTSKVTSMNQMFRQCYNLTELDLSNFNTISLTRTDLMFNSCNNLKTIYVSDKWVNDKITLSDRMFLGCISLSGTINYDSTKVDITYANYETGYFTYKKEE